jgi:hypothetical protein
LRTRMPLVFLRHVFFIHLAMKSSQLRPGS